METEFVCRTNRAAISLAGICLTSSLLFSSLLFSSLLFSCFSSLLFSSLLLSFALLLSPLILHFLSSPSHFLTSLLLCLLYFNSRCYAGFSGVNCSLPLCLSVNNCSGHGQCLEADLCTCDVGYTGADCSNVSCEGVNYCSGEEDILS